MHKRMERQHLPPAKPKGAETEQLYLNLNLKITVRFSFTLQAPALPMFFALPRFTLQTLIIFILYPCFFNIANIAETSYY